MKKLLIITLLVLILGTTACTIQKGATPVNANSDNASGELKKFGNMAEFRDFMAQSGESSGNIGAPLIDNVIAGGVAKTTLEAAAPSTSGAASIDHSQTNVQVQGVDEADFVKNDDKYLYVIAGNELIILQGTQKISDTKIIQDNNNSYATPTVRDFFLNGDQIILFVDNYEKTYYFQNYDITPIDSYTQNTRVIIYDVSDRTSPKVVQTYDMSGAYYDSRMIDKYVYVVTQDNINDYIHYEGPIVSYAAKTIRPDIYYFDVPSQNYQLDTITSINVDSKDVVDSKSFTLGYGTTLMVSQDNIYIAYQNQQYFCWGWRCPARDNDERARFTTAIQPLLEGDIKTKVDTIMSKGLSQDAEWSQLSQTFNDFYKELGTDEQMQNQYAGMFSNIQNALAEYDAKKAIENSKTIIQEIGIDNGIINYKAKGEVDGRLLNQFSMDEYDGNLRVATTLDVWLNSGRMEYNNVYVLDNNMNTIGSLTGLAENESIYSTRFVDDKLFLVTYRQIDPFFVIDLSVPTQPSVMGYLKIPGYSSYLQPINSTLILGVGKDTTTNEYGSEVPGGIKVSLYDVSDFSNPKEIDKYIIGTQGSDSPVLYDHKAFLYSASKNMLVLPVSEVVSRIKNGEYSYKTTIWNGAYVFNISDNITLLGKVKHSSAETDYYWFNQASVTRSAYIGDNLYTISNKYVKVTDLNNISEIGSVDLPGSDAPISYPLY